MKVWHCKKQSPSRTGIFQKKVGSPVADLRTRSTSDNVKVASRATLVGDAALLNDAIPVKFLFQIET